jgi:hypothetical protein
LMDFRFVLDSPYARLGDTLAVSCACFFVL